MPARSLVAVALALACLAPLEARASAARLLEGPLRHPLGASVDLAPGGGSDAGFGMLAARTGMVFLAEAAVATGVAVLSVYMLAAALDTCVDANFVCVFDRAFAWVMLLLVGEAFLPPLAGAGIAALLEESSGGRPSLGWTYLLTQAVWLVGAVIGAAVSETEPAMWAVFVLTGLVSSGVAVRTANRTERSGACLVGDPRPPVRPVDPPARREDRAGVTVLALAW